MSSLSSVPVKRFLNKPQIVRGMGSNLHTDMNASNSRAGRLLLTKVQRSRHKHPHDINHQIRVRLRLVQVFMRLVTVERYLKGKIRFENYIVGVLLQ